MGLVSYNLQFFMLVLVVLIPMFFLFLNAACISGIHLKTPRIRLAVFISLMFSFINAHAQVDWVGWPSADEADGRFLAISGPLSAINYVAPNIIIGIPNSATQFDIELFDGDAGADLNSKYDVNVSTSGYTYTLYQDPERDGTGSVVELTRTQADFANDTWSPYVTDHPVDNAAQGQDGFYWYRLSLVFNGNPDSEQFFNALKVRVKSDAAALVSVGALKEIIVGAAPFNPLLDPGLNSPANTYDGDWVFNIRVPNGVRESLDISDSDADFAGDANAPGQPPDDNFIRPEFRISPSIRYELFAPNGELIILNTDPSGTQEEETFSYTPPGEMNVPSGYYQWHWFGVDASNVLSLRTDFELLPEPPDVDPPLECGLTINKTCLVQAAPVGPFNCSDAKPIDELGMIWNGDIDVRIRAWKGSVGSTLLADIDNIAPGEEVIVSGFAGSPNDVYWEIFNAGTITKIGESKFHLSCSDDDMDGPEDCGAVLGNGKDDASGFINAWILELLSGNGAILDCTAGTPDGTGGFESCEFEAGPIPSCESTGKPENLTWKYTGGGCTASDNDQGNDATCSGAIDGSASVVITDDKGNIFAINPGEAFTTSRDASQEFRLANGGGNEVIRMHSSCSQPIQAGDVYGSLTLVALDGLTAGRGVDYFYEVANSGTDLTGVSLVDNLLGQVGGPVNLASGESVIFQASALLSETTTNIVDVSGMAGNEICTASDSTTVNVIPCTVEAESNITFDGDKLKWNVTNTSAFALDISRITITWPFENGFLKEIKLDGDSIHKGLFSPTTAVIDNGWEGDVDKRTIKAGETDRLEFKFDNDVVLDDVTIMVEFASGCSVSVKYQGPFMGSDFACEKPIDSLSMIWNGGSDIAVNAWKGNVGSTLLAGNVFVSDGGELTVSGYAGSPNDVFWEIFDAGTGAKLGESKFHLSCSDDDMDGPEDCGKAEGNGKDNSSGLINDWILEGMIDAKSTLDCTAGTGVVNGSAISRISSGSDDVEQRLSNGDMYFDSSDLELNNDTGYFGPQLVGMRFNKLNIPQGATITSAYIEFEADETDSVATSLLFRAQAADDAAPFVDKPYNLSNRTTTASSVNWAVPAWNTVGQKHRSPNLSAIIQEVVNRPGWSPSNSLVVMVSGSGERTAESYDGESANAPLLVIQYQL